MLNFVKELTKGDYSGLVKEWQVVLIEHPYFQEVKETFDYEHQAKEYVKEKEKDGYDIYSGYEIRGVKYE